MTDKEQFIETVREVAAAIGDVVTEDPVDYQKLSEITAIGIQNCLVGVASLLESRDKRSGGPDDLRQFLESEGA